jgi:hypothetical protein
MDNIGCVVYTETQNGIEAHWTFIKNDAVSYGTGIGVRLNKKTKKRQFEGDFDIVYKDVDGSESPKLKLTILFESNCYKLTWMLEGKITELGIGIVVDNKLSVGWCKTIDNCPPFHT